MRFPKFVIMLVDRRARDGVASPGSKETVLHIASYFQNQRYKVIGQTSKRRRFLQLDQVRPAT